MPELNPVAWALIGLVMLVVVFEMVRLLRVSGTFTMGTAISVTGVADYFMTADFGTLLGAEAISLLMMVLGAFKGYTRWRTGEIVREAPAVIGTGDGTRTMTGTGAG